MKSGMSISEGVGEFPATHPEKRSDEGYLRSFASALRRSPYDSSESIGQDDPSRVLKSS